VVINEYVDLAHAFFSEGQPGMVNGLLDNLGRQLRPEEFHDQGAR
jgi:N utilization substance protein B